MTMNPNRRNFLLAVGMLFLLVVPVICTLATMWPSLSQEAKGSILVTGLSAGGTLLLAIVMGLSIRQNRETIEEMSRQREKELVRDELRNIVSPAINSVERTLKDHKNKRVAWAPQDLPANKRNHGRPESAFMIDGHQAPKERLRNEDPTLWKMMKSYDNIVNELGNLGATILEQTEAAINDYVDEHSVLTDGETRAKSHILIRHVLNKRESGLPDYERTWENHGDQITDVVKSICNEKLEDFYTKQAELVEDSEELWSRLKNRQIKLQREFGISTDEAAESSKVDSKSFQV